MTAPALHERFPELRDTLPHVALGERPTPVRPLRGLSDGGAPVWLKDDGAFGDGGWGGNKVRKLEWILPEARRRGARTLLTVGGLGTNWGLAAALYAREQGLGAALALLDQPLDDHVRAQLVRLRRCGAALHFTHTKARTIAAVPWLVLRHSSRGHLPYVLPAGGSSPVGALGYVEASFELAAQIREGTLPQPSHIVTPLGSGATTAGLALGLRLAELPTRVVGVVVNDALRLDARTTVRLAGRTERLLRRRGAQLPDIALQEADITIVRDWLGPGYGHHTSEAGRAQDLAADREGLALDPVYTAKAMAALLAMNTEERFGDGPVLYLHTDGPR
jgi:D-cysteine desulfhydrase